MYIAISVIIILLCGLLALFVLAQNPKGGGLAAGFTGAQQIGGVQRTADFLEKGTWTLASALMVLCLVAAGVQRSGGDAVDEFDAPAGEVLSPGDDFDQSGVTNPEEAPAGNEEGE
jgi:preprotein translocase subunit SecG